MILFARIRTRGAPAATRSGTRRSVTRRTVFDLLVTATLFGAIIGGFTFGWLSDRLGRVCVVVWTIVLFAVFTGLCAPAQGFKDFWRP
jgi:MFS family permease